MHQELGARTGTLQTRVEFVRQGDVVHPCTVQSKLHVHVHCMCTRTITPRDAEKGKATTQQYMYMYMRVG